MKLKLLVLLFIYPAVAAAATDVLTWHNDNARTGQNLNEKILTLANVNSASFGKLFVVSVDGLVDAQPLVVSAVSLPGQGTHDLLLVATEHASVYAFDAATGAPLWNVSLLGTGESPSDDRGCSQVPPEIGVTATPVVDRSSGPNGAVYVVAMSKDSSGNYFERLYALDLSTGAELFGGPKNIVASYPGSGGSIVFDPKQYKERPGLLLLNHVVYTAWSSHCDIRPYTGWVMGYNETILAQVGVFNLTPNGNDGSVWASGAGPAADTNGNIFFLVANGTFDTSLDALGFPSQRDYGNAFVKLSTSGNSLAVADYFNMFDTVNESSNDEDLGSGGAMLLPDMTDAQGRTRHLAVGAGKDSNLYLADRDNMGKFNSANNSALYQELPGALGGAEFGGPAYFNGTIYYGAVAASLLAFQFSQARLASTPASSSATAFGYPGTTPSISASGTTNGIVWAAENSSPAVLHAYDAANLSHELYNSNQAAGDRDQFGDGNKFITPTIANGRVYVGTTNGVGVFALLSALPDFSLSAAAGSSLSAMVTAGQMALYQLTLAGVRGLSGTVQLACTGAPALATCTTNPNSVMLSRTSTASVTVTVATTARSTARRRPFLLPPPIRVPLTEVGFILLVASSILLFGPRATTRRRVAPALVAIFLMLAAIISCGGGGSSAGGGNPGTRAGTYTLSVTGTVAGSTSLTHSLNLTLTVN